MTAMLRAVRWTSALVLVAGCTQGFGTLNGVLVDTQPEARPLAPGEASRVEVSREGRSEQGRPNMVLKKGDEIVTAADGIVVMEMAGYQVIMDPGTDLTIENPSIFVRVGRIIVKKIKEVAEALTVNTELGAAAVEGTEFIVEVNRRDQVTLTVLEGRVRVYPKAAAGWRDTMTYVAGERGHLDSLRVTRGVRLNPREADTLRRRINEIEGKIRPVVPDLLGYPQAEAEAALNARGLRYRVWPVITRQPDTMGVRRARVDRGPAPGTVVAMNPPVGARVKQNAVVRISVEEESVLVPNLMGQPMDAAIQVLRNAGFSVDTTVSVQPNGTDGTVNGMQPSPGYYVRRGTKVGLTILRVQAAAPEGSEVIDRRGINRVVLCAVPQLAGLTEEQARAAIKEAKLGDPQVSYGAGSAVTSQTPEAGTRVVCGSTVSFMLGSAIR